MSRPDTPIYEALALRPDHVWIAEDDALFGWGVADRIDVGTGADRYRRAYEGLMAIGGLAFASFTFHQEQAGSTVTVPQAVARVTSSGIEKLFGDLPPGPRVTVDIPESNGQAAVDEWDDPFRAAMEELEGEGLKKIVLSRAFDVAFDSDVPATTVISNLLETQDHSYIFGVDGLVGSSPELLASLSGRKFVSLSLAGSSAPEAEGNGQLSNPKNRLEHDLAANSVASALDRVAVSIERSKTRRTVFRDIAHLATRFEGITHPGTTILDLIARLHPTAAVAGTPTDEALRAIRLLEHHDRGRYAGPVGWFDETGNGAFAIALRCGLIQGSQVRLFSGAGLVAGSDSESELAEIELKLKPMRRALGLI